ncbi:MAG TPA: hypothetical protein VFS20_28710 [Longimicrobium sp.]|nr:hypothetical protein [Longimicrobium sp.]
MIGVLIYKWSVDAGKPLSAVTARIRSLDLQADTALRQSNEMVARFAWHPTAVALIVVALGTIAACGYLIHHSLCDALGEKVARRWKRWIAILAAAVFVGLLLVNPRWILRTEVLAPLLEQALGRDSHASHVAEVIMNLAQALTFVAACCVVLAAAAALLKPRIDPGEDFVSENTRKLPDQWRRLTFTVYAGAALLVTAVVHHTSLAGWGAAYASAMAETRRDSIRVRVDSLASVKAALDLATATFNLDSLTDSADAVGRNRKNELGPERKAAQASHDSLTHAIILDTMAIAARIERADTAMKHVNELTTAAIRNGGGLLYTLLLMLTYLPAALILMERAKELSEAANPDTDNATRATWRNDQRIEFSFSTQWGKLLAMFSPLIASSGLAFLFDFFK